VTYQKPIPRCFVVTEVRTPQTTENENTYLECDTDEGVVAFWGSPSNMTNIRKIRALDLPARVAAGCIDSNWDQHQFWCPENAGLIV